jgi:hypothetical protein
MGLIMALLMVSPHLQAQSLDAAAPKASDAAPAGENAEYSYQSDRAFFHPADFRGISFNPETHISIGENETVQAGSVTLTFGSIDLTISGVEGLDSTYYLANIQRSPEGFLAEIINPKHPSAPMRLVIETDEEHFITQMELQSRSQGKHLFKLPKRSPLDRAKLDALYTNRIEFHLEEYDTTTFFEFVPFLIEPDVAAESGMEVLDGETKFVFGPDTVVFIDPDGAEHVLQIHNIEHDQFGEEGAASTRYRILLELNTVPKPEPAEADSLAEVVAIPGAERTDQILTDVLPPATEEEGEAGSETKGKKGRKGRKKRKDHAPRGEPVVMALFFDTWHDLEYVVLGPARYYPRP